MGGNGRIGVAVDFSECSKKALRWALENSVCEGDHVILIHIRPEGDYEQGEMQLWEATGSPLIPLHEFSDAVIMKKYGVMPDQDTLNAVQSAAKQKKVTVVMKIYWGDPRERLCEAIDTVPLTHLVIGNRGLGKLKRVLLGSVSNHVVNNGSCPVTVVKHVEHHG
ncbi:PREDICTED: universal stress protein PHOS32-like [Nelumbo nucifera]|uniref:UspA domain-containing protein n=2 Tax=Nelumbo nucifera TaxID=4432 RepID=A0A822YQ16_NELNU|nr:PREDICTED: universal stress protein PHOS32-like [Nelumbo nucifera]DAD33115.1 TPA_asm: hypothetical protein HUJ06_011966 [Nelumbo nucifera]